MADEEHEDEAHADGREVVLEDPPPFVAMLHVSQLKPTVGGCRCRRCHGQHGRRGRLTCKNKTRFRSRVASIFF